MKTMTAVMNAHDMVTNTTGTRKRRNMFGHVTNVRGTGEIRMTYKEASSVIEKYLKCRNEPCIDNRECSYCEYETGWKEQDEAFKLAIEALKCMRLNADIINADAMHKLFITGEMTMEDFRKMCGKELNVPDTNVGDMISRQDAIKHLKKRLYETALNSNTEHPYYEEIADNRIDTWMNEVPSAASEIIHCGDCWYKDDGIDEDGIPFLKCLNGRSYGGTRINDFCSWAERRTDEADCRRKADRKFTKIQTRGNQR